MRRVTAVLLVLGVAAGCAKQEEKVAAAPPAPGTREWKIQNATSAGPEAVVTGAKVLDIVPGDTVMPVLRPGTTDWTCYPDDPATPANDPSCSDSVAAQWYDAWMAHRPPHLTGIGVAYLLQGGQVASVTDPYKTKPDAGGSWVDLPPCVFLVVPDARALRGLPTAPAPDKPWVMYAGTPYAVLIVPQVRPAAAPEVPAAPQP